MQLTRRRLLDRLRLPMPSRRQVHAPMADQDSPDAMGRQARDRPPNGIMERLNWDIAPGAAISPPLRLLGLGLPPGSYPTAPEIAGELSTMISCRISVVLGRILVD